VEPETRKRRRLSRIGVAVALAVTGALGLALDWPEVRRVLGQADWTVSPLALLCTSLFYGCLSYGFAVLSAIFGIRMEQRILVAIGFVSIALNHLLAAGGVAGHSLRLLLMRRRGIAAGDILAASLFHSYLNNVALVALLPAGLIYLTVDHPFSAPQLMVVGVATGLLLLAFGLATVTLFVDRLRAPVFRTAAAAWRALTRRDDLGGLLRDLDQALGRGVAAIRTRPVVLALPLGLIATDWAFSVLAMAACFHALGDPVRPGVLLTGFAVGVTAGLVSMVPGGLGVQEGSMAGVYALLGVPFEQAVLAAVLFRVVYYLIPFGAALGLYWHLASDAARPPARLSEDSLGSRGN
jgi:uncharacterized protein (TIRG00374 family)